MPIKQISVSNTFGQLVTVMSGLVSVFNYFTTGPRLISNTQLTLTSLNVANDAIIAHTANVRGTFIAPFVSANTLTVSGTITTKDAQLGVGQFLSSTANSFVANAGTVILATLNTSVGTVTSGRIDALTGSAGTMTVGTANIANLIMTSGNATFGRVTFPTGNLTLLTTNVTIYAANALSVSNCTLSNCTFVSPQGLVKANVGLSNVDDTSDSTKNSATANLSNKTLLSPLIVTGTVSADPTVDGEVANYQYVANNSTQPYSMIINGNMEVWQRGNTFAAITTAYAADLWYYASPSGTGVVTANRSNDVPTFTQSNTIFNSSLELDVTTADASIAAGDLYYLKYAVEGHNWRRFAQKPCFLSFWVRSTIPGTYGIALQNPTPDRNLIVTYTINSADTWEYKTVVIPASPSAGTWDYTTGTGVSIYFTLAGGSTYQKANANVSSWDTDVNKYTTASQVNALSSTSNFFRLTGVKYGLGVIDQPIHTRNFQEELLLCQRYYQKSGPYSSEMTQGGVSINSSYMWPASNSGTRVTNTQSIMLCTAMVSPPTITLYAVPGGSSGQVRDITTSANCTGSSGVAVSNSAFYVTSTGAASVAVGDEMRVHWVASAPLS